METGSPALRPWTGRREEPAVPSQALSKERGRSVPTTAGLAFRRAEPSGPGVSPGIRDLPRKSWAAVGKVCLAGSHLLCEAACCPPPPRSILCGQAGRYVGQEPALGGEGLEMQEKSGAADSDQEEGLLGPPPKLPGHPPLPDPLLRIHCALHSQECREKLRSGGEEAQAGWQPCQTPYGAHYWPQRSLFGARVSKVTACAAAGVGDGVGAGLRQERAGLPRPNKAWAESRLDEGFPSCAPRLRGRPTRLGWHGQGERTGVQTWGGTEGVGPVQAHMAFLPVAAPPPPALLSLPTSPLRAPLYPHPTPTPSPLYLPCCLCPLPPSLPLFHSPRPHHSPPPLSCRAQRFVLVVYRVGDRGLGAGGPRQPAALQL